MENNASYSVIARNKGWIENLVSIEVYKTPSKVTEEKSFLTIPTRNGFSSIRLPFTETIEKDKTYYYYRHCGGEKAVTINRTTPMEALRDALHLLTKKNPTTIEPYLLSVIMGKTINTLRKMYQEGNIYSVGFVMGQDQTYLLNYLNTENDVITVHDDFLIH